MDHIVDLDELAVRLQEGLHIWRAFGTVTEFTWRDERDSRRQRLSTDRVSVLVPESLGFTIVHDWFHEFQFVAWTGGWADINYIKDDAVVSRTPKFSTVEQAFSVAQREIERFSK
jgi:hypothetical protein